MEVNDIYKTTPDGNRKGNLSTLIKQAGPNDITYPQAGHKLRLTSKTMEKLGDHHQHQLYNARKNLNNYGLRDYVEVTKGEVKILIMKDYVSKVVIDIALCSISLGDKIMGLTVLDKDPLFKL